MKKTYIKPEMQTIETEPICSSLISASVHESNLQGKVISNFDVVEQQQTRLDEKYSTLWGSSNKDNWGDD